MNKDSGTTAGYTMTKLRSTIPYLVKGTQGYRGTAGVPKMQPLPYPQSTPIPTPGGYSVPLPFPSWLEFRRTGEQMD